MLGLPGGMVRRQDSPAPPSTATRNASRGQLAAPGNPTQAKFKCECCCERLECAENEPGARDGGRARGRKCHQALARVPNPAQNRRRCVCGAVRVVGARANNGHVSGQCVCCLTVSDAGTAGRRAGSAQHAHKRVGAGQCARVGRRRCADGRRGRFVVEVFIM
jgi:hypothetical protein